MTWLHAKGKQWTFDLAFRTNVAANTEGVVKRAEILACKAEREEVLSLPLQKLVNLISYTRPRRISRISVLRQW